MRFLITVLSEHLRLNYLHLMNKAAEAEDRQSYFHYLKLAEIDAAPVRSGQTLMGLIPRCRVISPEQVDEFGLIMSAIDKPHRG